MIAIFCVAGSDPSLSDALHIAQIYGPSRLLVNDDHYDMYVRIHINAHELMTFAKIGIIFSFNFLLSFQLLCRLLCGY